MRDIKTILSENIKYYREQRNLSQEGLGFISGLHRTFISSIECKRKNATIESIEKIAIALEIEPYKLLMERIVKHDENSRQ